MAGRGNAVILKQRVEELEKQVEQYKQKLENLRKAKNTTITKREREVLEIKGPNLGQKALNDAKVAELEEKLRVLEKSKRDEMEALQKEVSDQIEALTLQEGRMKERVSDNDELERLRAENAALRLDNEDLRSQVDMFQTELSIKEAEWCDKEEHFKHKLEKSWKEKYAEWMAKTEQKMEELFHANNVLRQMLNSQAPPEN